MSWNCSCNWLQLISLWYKALVPFLELNWIPGECTSIAKIEFTSQVYWIWVMDYEQSTKEWKHFCRSMTFVFSCEAAVVILLTIVCNYCRQNDVSSRLERCNKQQHFQVVQLFLNFKIETNWLESLNKGAKSTLAGHNIKCILYMLFPSFFKEQIRRIWS